MPEWLQSYCANISLFVAGLVATVGVIFLIIIASVEIYDFFADRNKKTPNPSGDDGYLFNDETFR